MVAIRIVPLLRAAHFNLFPRYAPATTYYFDPSYELVDRSIEGPYVRSSRSQIFLALLRAPSGTTLEIWEPLWMRHFFTNFLFVFAFRSASILRRTDTAVVTYAMENNDLSSLLIERSRLWTPVERIARALIRTYISSFYDRIAFATPGAEHLYLTQIGFPAHRSRLYLDLPSMGTPRNESASGAVFVGDLSRRKGVNELMAAWAIVENRVPGAVLTCAGTGDMVSELQMWCARAPHSRKFLGSLSSVEVGETLLAASVIVLPSVRDGRWREQVGLPIREGLQAGLTVVTTTETGLAPWLKAHGHHVVVPGSEPALADGISAALTEPLAPTAVAESLPVTDHRVAANRYLHDAILGTET